MITSVQGGRGKRSPYKVSTVSVPVDIVPLIKRVCHLYRNLSLVAGLDFAKQQCNRLSDAIDIVENDTDDTPIHIGKHKLDEILQKIEAGQSGYKKNSASQMILELKELRKLL